MSFDVNAVRGPRALTLLSALLLGVGVACDVGSGDKAATEAPKPAPAPREKAAKVEKAPRGPGIPGPASPEEIKALPAYYKGWKTIPERVLSEAQQVQRKRALETQKAAATGLMTALTTAISESGHAAAVDVCKLKAPEVAKSVGDSMDVRIGRTSAKLRNPANTPPTWAEDLLAVSPKGVTYRAAPDGTLGVFSPAMTQGLCLGCHGAADALAEGVPEALATAYPQDQATGFKEGDVRGYFWVEVPAP